MEQKNYRLLFSLPVIVASLGYFVDIYDLLLFSIVHSPSLKELGVPDDQIFDKGAASPAGADGRVAARRPDPLGCYGR